MPTTRPARAIKIEEPGVIAIRVDRDIERLEVEEVSVANHWDETPARGFRCTRFGGERLHVILAIDGSANDVCTCETFAYRAACIHALGFRALLKRGQLEKLSSAA